NEHPVQAQSLMVPARLHVILMRLFVECQSNAAETARRYDATKYTTRPLNVRYVRPLVKKSDKTGSVCDAKRTGRPHIATDDVSACAVVDELLAEDLLNTLWCQQDGAPAHYAPTVRDYLNETFATHCGGPMDWLARSTDWKPRRTLLYKRNDGGHFEHLLRR
ncbi:unnamed protein product, partial [Dicrocoelium dendriticum]